MQPADGAATPAGTPDEITFANLPDWHELFCQCRACGRESSLNRRALVKTFGPGQPVLPLARMLRCTKCANKDGNVIRIGKVKRYRVDATPSHDTFPAGGTPMCGRVYIKSTLDELLQGFSLAEREAVLGMANQFPRYNGAPSLYYPIIIRDVVRDPDVFGPTFVSARWGLVPAWVKEQRPGRPPPVNARCEGIASNGMFKKAYASQRCLIPIDGFFEWKDIHGTGKNKQPYAIAMKSGEPFALAGIWEKWRNPETGEDIRTFCVVTCPPNQMMATIHDRMPVVLHREDYELWLSPEPDPSDLMKPFPAELMTMWPIKRKVGSSKNDTADILDPIEPI